MTSPDETPAPAKPALPALGPALGEVLLVTGGTLGLLLAARAILGDWNQWFILLWFVIPVALAVLRGEDPIMTFGLAPERPLRGLLVALALSATLLPLFAIGATAYLTGGERFLAFDLELATKTLANHLVLVALHEEAFFRGYVQGKLEGAPSNNRLGADDDDGPPKASLGRVAIAFAVTAVLFGAYHPILEGSDLSRMNTALPGLLFCLLRHLSGDIWAAVLFHAACNAVLFGVQGGLAG